MTWPAEPYGVKEFQMTTMTGVTAVEVAAMVAEKTAKVDAAKKVLSDAKACPSSIGTVEARQDAVNVAKKALHAAKENLRRYCVKVGYVNADAEWLAKQAATQVAKAEATKTPVVVEVAPKTEPTAAPVVVAPVEKWPTLAKAAAKKAGVTAETKVVDLTPAQVDVVKAALPVEKPAKAPKAAKPVVEKPAKPTSEKTYRELAAFISLSFAADCAEIADFLGFKGVVQLNADQNVTNIVRRACLAIGAEWTTTDSGTFAQMWTDGQVEGGEGYNENINHAHAACGNKIDTKVDISVIIGSHPAHPKCPCCGKPMFKSMKAGKVFKHDAWAFCRNMECAKWNTNQADGATIRPVLFLDEKEVAHALAAKAARAAKA
jgi:hypothetical protein